MDEDLRKEVSINEYKYDLQQFIIRMDDNNQ